jgi:hypothetical protein
MRTQSQATFFHLLGFYRELLKKHNSETIVLCCIMEELRRFDFAYLVPKSPHDLIRLGSEFDGGYVVSQKVVKKSQMLLTFGNGFNIDFEWDYVKQNQFRKKAIVFDGTHKLMSF